MLTDQWASHPCSTTSCVEVRQDTDRVAQVRDSTLVDDIGRNTSPVLSFGAAQWREFVRWAPTL